mmetsp:Transcript_8068/g.19501  ORF Transcript_8068/g.19501 Transcript_8068/m.19501 type:complete len:268 (+) Transcript_8068:3498-4301(+)
MKQRISNQESCFARNSMLIRLEGHENPCTKPSINSSFESSIFVPSSLLKEVERKLSHRYKRPKRIRILCEKAPAQAEDRMRRAPIKQQGGKRKFTLQNPPKASALPRSRMESYSSTPEPGRFSNEVLTPRTVALPRRRETAAGPCCCGSGGASASTSIGPSCFSPRTSFCSPTDWCATFSGSSTERGANCPKGGGEGVPKLIAYFVREYLGEDFGSFFPENAVGDEAGGCSGEEAAGACCSGEATVVAVFAGEGEDAIGFSADGRAC